MHRPGLLRSRAPRAIPTTVSLPPELRRDIELVRDRLRADHPEASLGDAVRTVMAAGVEALGRRPQDSQPPPSRVA